MWRFSPFDSKILKRIVEELEIDKRIAILLVKRGVKSSKEAEAFLNPDLSYLHDPFLFRDMKEAVNRLLKARDKKEKIVIFGDYDVDGITGTSLLIRAFKKIGLDVSYYIPHRIDEGYGMSIEGIDYARRLKSSLIVTVDNGITGNEEISYARSLGIDVIVTDHHEPREVLPANCLILNPLIDELYPYKFLAGVGVAFKLVEGIYKTLNIYDEVKEFIYFVALGTVADMVPLTGENRILVKHGLEQINNNTPESIQVLKNMAAFKNHIKGQHISFILGPRLNAAGRMEHAKIAVELFITDDKNKIEELASKLEALNHERKEEEQRVFSEALECIDDDIPDFIVLSANGWHEGVVGIVSSKLTELYNRPAIVLSIQGDEARGSGRGIDSFSLIDALHYSKDLLLAYGGHKNACGLRIKKENIEMLKKRLNDYVSQQKLFEQVKSSINVDMEIAFKDIGDNIVNMIRKLEPTGFGNPAPVFLTRGLQVESLPEVIKGKHIKFKVKGDRKTFNVIGFQKYNRLKEFNKKIEKVDIVYSIASHDFKGLKTIELIAKDFLIK